MPILPVNVFVILLFNKKKIYIYYIIYILIIIIHRDMFSPLVLTTRFRGTRARGKTEEWDSP